MKLNSYTITQGRDRAPARAMLKGIGFTDEDLAKPIIGVANTWIETMPCNYNLRELAVFVKEGIRAAGGTPMEFNTIAISDGVTMGTEGMKTSLVSREVIADSIELLVRGHMFDGVVALVACDKTIPGAAMAMLRLNIPGVILYGGSILPGRHAGRDISIQDVFEAVGAHARGRISDEELRDIEDHACPGAGACGGQFTANTMATVMELIGLAPMGTASVPQVDKRKEAVAARCGRIIMDAVRSNLRARDICTRKAFDNAIAGVAASGGSTNAVLHLLAMAREAEVPLSIDDFDVVCARTPVFVDIKPAGRYMAADVDTAGRHSGDREAATRRQVRRWIRHDGDRPHVWGGGRGCARDAGAGRNSAVGQGAEAARRHRHSARQSGAGGLRDQAGRAREEAPSRSRARV